MGKKQKQYEENAEYLDCDVCEGEIILEYFHERGDLLNCDECGAEYIIKSRHPVKLTLLEDDMDEFDEDGFDGDED